MYNTKYIMNYCAPSISPECIKITPELSSIFRNLSNHFTCISGYNFDNGSFRAASYDAAILLISGENILNQSNSPQTVQKILYALRELWNKVNSAEWKQYFEQKYSIYPNYPIDVRLFYGGAPVENESLAYRYCLSLRELEFMIMVFDTYVKHNLYLLPCE